MHDLAAQSYSSPASPHLDIKPKRLRSTVDQCDRDPAIESVREDYGHHRGSERQQQGSSSTVPSCRLRPEAWQVQLLFPLSLAFLVQRVQTG